MNYFRKKLTIALLAVCAGLVGLNKTDADIIDIIYDGGDARVGMIIQGTMEFWNSRVPGWRADLPAPLLNRLGTIQITATAESVDGEFGILGFASTSEYLEFRPTKFGKTYLMPQAGTMNLDLDDLDAGPGPFGTLSFQEWVEVMSHEVGHVLGLTTLDWGVPNGLIDEDIDNGLPGIIAQRAVEAYREEINDPFAPFATMQLTGGAGSAFSHPRQDDLAYIDFVSQFTGLVSSELMRPFFIPGITKDIGSVMAALLAEGGYGVIGQGDPIYAPTGPGGGGRRGPNGPKNGGREGAGGFLRYGGDVSSIPEPGSMVILGVVAVCGLGLRRRRR